MDIQELFEYLQETYPISFHEECLKEVVDLVERSGGKKDFIRRFLECAQKLCLLSPEQATKTDVFEKLKGRNAHGLYRMKFTKPCNIRIIYTYREDGKILLLAFLEKGGKRSTDYTDKLKPAQDRLSEMIGG